VDETMIRRWYIGGPLDGQLVSVSPSARTYVHLTREDKPLVYWPPWRPILELMLSSIRRHEYALRRNGTFGYIGERRG
jgi:hypothetical protein